MITTSDLRDLRAELSQSGVFDHRTAHTWTKLVLLLLALAAAIALVVLLPWWCGLLLVPLAAVPAVTAAMIGHEAAHGSFASSKRHNEIVLYLVFPLFGGLGAEYWKRKHNHLHHGHPNVVGRDPDLDVWPMALSSAAHAGSSRLRRWIQRTAQGYLFWPLTLLLAFTMRYDTGRYIAGRLRDRRVDGALLIDIACLLGHYALWLAIPMLWFGVWPVLLLYDGLWATTGLLLALIFAPAHMGMPVMDADQRAGWQQQLDTTRNLAMPGWLSWFFVGLDFQVEHHLFPRIPHQNLPRASDIVAPWCERVGVPYHRLGYVSSIRQVTRHVRLSWQVVPEVVVVKSNPLKVQRLAIGERVFYPTHGVAAVTGIEEHDFGDSKQVFYVLQLTIDRGVKLMLPERNLDQANLRELVSAAKARELLKAVVKEPPPREIKVDPASRKERANGYAEAFRSGSADRYTEILQELLFRSRTGKLSPSDQQTFDAALSFFIGEIGTVLDRPPREVEADLRSFARAPAPAPVGSR